MLAVLTSLLGLLVTFSHAQTSVEAQAKVRPPAAQTAVSVTVQDFNWGADGRYNVKIAVGSENLQFRGDLRDNSKSEPQKKGQTTIALRHFQQGFLILAVTLDNEELAFAFLIEGFAAPYNIMNTRAIRARKIEGAPITSVLAEFEAIIDGFKITSRFDTAQSMRKMAEYFGQYPLVKAHELAGLLENDKENDTSPLKKLARPKNSGGANDQGLQQPQMPAQIVQGPAPTKQPGDPMNLRPYDGPPGPDDDFQDPQQAAWLAQEKARLKAERERRAREIQAQRQQGQIVGYDAYNRPIYQQQPRAGGYYPSQQQPGGFFQQQQQPGFYQQQQPYYRSNPLF